MKNNYNNRMAETRYVLQKHASKYKNCKSCVYRCENHSNGTCNYLLITGHMRGRQADQCTKYRKGKKIDIPNDEYGRAISWEED